MRRLCRLSVVAMLWLGVSTPGQAQSPTRYDREIQEIAARPAVQRALQIARELEREGDAELVELTEVPAPPFREERRAERYRQLLMSTGLTDVEVDDVGNVIGTRPGTEGGSAVAIVAHLDTVFPVDTDVTVRRRGSRLYAPGIGDDTRGLVLLLNVARALNRAEVQTGDDILFVGSVGEEGLGDLRGVKHLFREGGPRIDQFLAIDGGDDSVVLNEALGSRRYRITFTGSGGHSWGAFGLGNPAHALASAIHFFNRDAGEFVRSGARTSYNIGVIGGGTSVNSVPFESWAEVDMRSLDRERLREVEQILQRAVRQALDDHNRRRGRGEPLQVSVDLVGDRPSGRVDPETPLIQRAMAVTRHLGLEPGLGIASTDANIPIARGIPAVTIGRGGAGGGAHSLDEWWAGVDAHISVQRALLILVASVGLSP